MKKVIHDDDDRKHRSDAGAAGYLPAAKTDIFFFAPSSRVTAASDLYSSWHIPCYDSQCKTDGSTVPVLRTFMQEHFDNGVVPRLMGWDTDDGLTTLHPSMDDAQRYTILREIGMGKTDFCHCCSCSALAT